MDASEELRLLRARIDDLQVRLDRLAAAAEVGDPAIVVQVVAETAVPTVANSFFAFVPVDLSGREAEGIVPTLTPRSGAANIRYAANVGPTAPKAGDFFVADQVGRYWVIANA